MDGGWQPAVDGGFDGWRGCGAGGCGDGDGYAGGFERCCDGLPKIEFRHDIEFGGIECGEFN